MAAVNYTSARFSAQDDNGRPLVGGKLYTYQNGTTTPAVTYTDAAGTQPNTNPIILNARGEAVVHIVDTQVYSFTLKNRFSVLVWSQDGITGVASSISFLAFIASLLSSIGSTLIGFIQAGTGAVRRSMQDKMRDTIDIRDYGAIGDGVHDDTEAIQRAIDACIAAEATLVDGKGGKFLTGPLDFNGTGHAEPPEQQWNALKAFRGAGRFSTIFLAKAGAYESGDWIVTARNTAGVSYSGFGYNGLNIAQQGFDFSWAGGEAGPGSGAPSNQNVYRDIYGTGVTGWGFNFDQAHDSVIDGILSRGVADGNYAYTFRGAGGQISASNIYAATGRVVVSCQNGGISDSGFYGGYEIAGQGFDNLVHNCVHFYPDPTTSVTILSTASGNAPCGLVFNACYFNTTPGWMVAGNFSIGAAFNACLFNNAAGGFYGTINPISGAGDVPLFTYEYCSFFGAMDLPGNAAGFVSSSHLKSKTNTGASYTNVLIPGTMASISLRGTQAIFGSATEAMPTDAAACVTGAWFRIKSNIAGQTPASLPGFAFGYNRTGGDGDCVIAYNSGGAPFPRVTFANTSGGGYTETFTVAPTAVYPGGTDNIISLGLASNRYSTVYAGTGAIDTSDETAKQDITAIPEAVLQAWAEVQFVQFRFRDAVAGKGAGARTHTGLIAQRIRDAFQSRGLDPFTYGVLCYDEWPDQWNTIPATFEETGELDAEGAPVMRQVEPERRELAQPAGSRYGVRYGEAFALEMAYQRSVTEALSARLATLEAK